MTWAIGVGNPLGGYGVVLSDVQVTFGDGTTADLLRKAYPVAPFLIGAFAGSVRIGFELLENIAQSLALPADAADVAWHPEFVAERWAPRAREVFDRAANEQKQLGSQFLLVGVDPVADVIAGRARPYVYRFSWPLFEPQLLARADAGMSIGSGAGIQEYTDAVQEALSLQSGLLHGEVNNEGGWGQMLGFAINRFLADHPVAGISTHIHIQLASRRGFTFGTSDQRIHHGDQVIDVRMPEVAESYEQLLVLGAQLGADVATARA